MTAAVGNGTTVISLPPGPHAAQRCRFWPIITCFGVWMVPVAAAACTAATRARSLSTSEMPRACLTPSSIRSRNLADTALTAEADLSTGWPLSSNRFASPQSTHWSRATACMASFRFSAPFTTRLSQSHTSGVISSRSPLACPSKTWAAFPVVIPAALSPVISPTRSRRRSFSVPPMTASPPTAASDSVDTGSTLRPVGPTYMDARICRCERIPKVDERAIFAVTPWRLRFAQETEAPLYSGDLWAVNRLTTVNESDNLPAHAFVSYVREDSRQVEQMQQALEAAGVPVWRDTANLWPGQDWREKIRHAITGNALVFIACFSEASLARDRSYQNEELVLAIDELRQRRGDVPWFIPVRLDECDIPDLYIGGGRTLASIQRADLFGGQFGKGIKRLIESVLSIMGTQNLSVIADDRLRKKSFDDRFARAVEHLGSPSETIRLGGIYELERIAANAATDGSSVEFSIVMSLLATFVREHSDKPWPDNREPPYWAPTPEVIGVRRSERLRQHPPLPDVTIALAVIGRRDSTLDNPDYPIDLSGANISLALLNKLDFTAVNLYRANLIGAELRRTDLTGARLAYANLNLVTAGEVKLVRAELTGAVMSGADLVGADLREADLSLADFSSAKLQHANLSRTNLARANLEGADLTGAITLETNLQAAHINVDTKLPPRWRFYSWPGDDHLRDHPTSLSNSKMVRFSINLARDLLMGAHQQAAGHPSR